jgi:hypothetical protein
MNDTLERMKYQLNKINTQLYDIEKKGNPFEDPELEGLRLQLAQTEMQMAKIMTIVNSVAAPRQNAKSDGEEDEDEEEMDQDIEDEIRNGDCLDYDEEDDEEMDQEELISQLRAHEFQQRQQQHENQNQASTVKRRRNRKRNKKNNAAEISERGKQCERDVDDQSLCSNKSDSSAKIVEITTSKNNNTNVSNLNMQKQTSDAKEQHNQSQTKNKKKKNKKNK